MRTEDLVAAVSGEFLTEPMTDFTTYDEDVVFIEENLIELFEDIPAESMLEVIESMVTSIMNLEY